MDICTINNLELPEMLLLKFYYFKLACCDNLSEHLATLFYFLAKLAALFCFKYQTVQNPLIENIYSKQATVSTIFFVTEYALYQF